MVLGSSRAHEAEDSCELRVGELVEYERRLWRVGLVNFTRARLDPLTNSSGVIDLHGLNGTDPDYKRSVNVGPASTLRRLSLEEAANYGKSTSTSNRTESVNMESDNTAEIPVPAKKDRINTRVARTVNRTRKATGSAKTASKPRTARKKVEPRVADKPCKCGCGEKTASHFVAGHDARFKGWLLKIERGQAKKEDLLKKAVISAYTWKKKGKGEVPTLNYKGEKHTGYESTSEA